MSVAYVLLFSLLGSSLSYNLQDFGCGGKPKVINALTQLRGDIYSPGYEEGLDYPEDLFCEYTITAPDGFLIRLKFVDMDIEAFDLCGRDKIAIFVGVSSMDPLVGFFCGNSTYPDIISKGNSMHIVFRSDFMVGKKGFHLQYHASVTQTLCNLGERPCRNRECFKLSQQCDGKDDCGDGTDEESCGHPLAKTSCGLRPNSSDIGADRVVGGREAKPRSWPWQADLQLSYFHPNGHFCGGTLLNNQWVVTAAHCFGLNEMPHHYRIHFGNHHKFYKDQGEQVRYAERIIIYPNVTDDELADFELSEFTHDIALIKLNAPVKFSETVKPACIPDQDYQPKTGTKCIATGWGTTLGTGQSHVLKEVDLWIEEPRFCDGEFGSINDSTQICTSNREGQQDVCSGDSGGPLVCEYDGKWHIMGATSFGTAGTTDNVLCALSGAYTIYSKVSVKANWIDDMINEYS